MSSTTPTYESGETPWIRSKRVTRSKEQTAVESLQPGESIAYSIQPKTGTGTFGSAVGSGSSASEVTHWADGLWAAVATKTGGAPLDVGLYRIRWTITIGDGVAVEDDALRIKP